MKVKFIGKERCRKCAMPMGPYSGPQDECSYCRGADLRFRGATAPCRYDGVARELIHAFKYRNATFLGEAFAELMIRDLAATDIVREVGLVMAVPLHWQRQAKRGYNQAEVLAERVARQNGLPTAFDNLVRVKNTPTQTARTRAERQENLRGAFAVRRPNQVDGRKILLCDDVMTTGATASECARVLREAGAKAVYVSVAAR